MLVNPAREQVTRSSSALNIALLVVAAAALLVRVPSIAEPLGIDQSLWASAVRGMARGQLLYQDVWEQRPPGIYFIYLLGFTLLGWVPATVAWLDIFAATVTTVLLWAIVSRLSDGRNGAVAAALYALFTLPPWLYGYGGFLERSVCETFIVVCVALAAWCAVRFAERPLPVFAFGVGVACGAAVVLKPNAGLYLPALLLWALIYGRRAGGGVAGHSVRALTLAAAGALLLPALTLGWLWRLGLLQEAGTAVIDFNRFYVGEGFSPGTYIVDFSKAVFLRMKTDPLWLAGAIGSISVAWELVRRRSLSPVAALAVIWGAAAALAIVVNGARLFNSYFIQAVPPLAVLATWLLTDAARGSWPRRLTATGTAILMLVVLGQRSFVGRVLESTGANVAVLRGDMTRIAYLERFGGYANGRGYSARAIAELAEYVRAHTTPEDRIFLFGISGAGIYFEADRLTAHRFLRVNFFVASDFPDPRFTVEAVARELAASRPRYFIFERLNAVSPKGAAMGAAVDALPEHPTMLALLEGYRRESAIEDFTLYRRVD